MNNGQRQVIAEKISSTVRVLELLGFDYKVSAPKNKREKGNRSPRVIYVNVGKSQPFRIYNSTTGNTWANERTVSLSLASEASKSFINTYRTPMAARETFPIR